MGLECCRVCGVGSFVPSCSFKLIRMYVIRSRCWMLIPAASTLITGMHVTNSSPLLTWTARIQPHSTPFVHEQGWFGNHKSPSYSTFSTARTSSLQYSPDSWWTKLHYGGAKFRVEEHDKICIPGSVWVAGESV